MINLFKRKKKQKRAWVTADNLKAGLSLPTGYIQLSKCPEVVTAVNKIADLISNMTIYLMQNSDIGDIRIKNELSKKIDINPCENMSRKSWMFFIVRTLLLEGDGNAVIIPSFEENGGRTFIKNLLPVPAADFSIVEGATFLDGYKILIGARMYDPDELIHFRINPDVNTLWRGRSFRIPVSQLVKTLNAGENVKQEFMNGRYMPSLILQVNADAKELTDMDGKNKIIERYTASEKIGAPWVIPDELMDVKTITPLSLKSIGVTESVAQNKKAIAALLGVPAFILGEGSFDAQEYNTFINDKVLSIAKEIEQTLTSSLLIDPSYYFKFNMRSLYSYDIQTLANVGGEFYDKGIMTGNEVREWLDLSPVEELEQFRILENYINVEDVGKQKKLDKEVES